MELLLVEDDAVSSEVLSLLLSADGWQVTAAESGEAALSVLRQAAALPPVVLCDQKLPGIQGAALATALRKVYRDSEQRIILLGMTATRNAAAQGYDSILIKPFSAADLRATVEGALPGSKGPHDLSHTEGIRAEPQAINPEVFDKLRSMGDAGARELYLFALSDARKRVELISTAFHAEDLSGVSREAHMLKGSAGMIGADRLAFLAASLETPELNDSETGWACRAKLAMLGPALDDIELMLETLLPARS